MSTVQSDPTAAVEQAIDLDSAKIVGRTPWQLFWRRFKKDRLAFVGMAVIVALIVLGISAPLVAKLVGHGPNQSFSTGAGAMTNAFGLPLGPNSKFWFGADGSLGRDLFVRVIYGIRTTLTVALLATALSVMVGVILGIMAGFFKGVVDTVISRIIDIILSMPILLFAIGIVAACSTTKEGCLGGLIKPGVPVVVAVIALFSWPYIARIVRGSTLSIREKEFIEASRSLGAGNRRIMFKEILPNLLAPILVYSTLIIPSNILFEAYLSFLGLGLPQRVPSWGRMLSDAARLFEVAWWLMLFPGLFLFLTTLAFNLLGDGLRDALDPRTGRG
ncbi:MAG: ABC transporter permease [Actinobacteria bacterium]|nr:ABC transporter permease [Actinomycetota bacterium]